MFGIGLGFKHDYEQMDGIDTEIADGVFQRKLVLSPGDYVFVSHLYSTLKESLQMAVGGTIGEPSYCFRVRDK